MAASPAFAEDPADALFREGIEAVNGNKVPLAYEKFKAAWSLRQSFDIAANLGVVEKALGKKRDAAEHFDYALRHFPASNMPQQRAEMETELASLKKELGELRIQSATGATIEVNGTAVGTCPLPAPIFVEPGQQIIVAKKPDIGEGRITVIVAVGEGKDIRVELSLSSGGGRSDGALPLWPGFLMGGVGLAAAGVGIPLLVLAQGKLSDADKLSEGIVANGGQCVEGNPDAGDPDCRKVQDALDSAGVLNGAGIPLVAVGGALLIAGVVWLVIPRDHKESKPPVAFAPWFGSDGGGLLLGGSF